MPSGASRSSQKTYEMDDGRVESVERDRLMPERGTLNVDKARRLLGWEPQVGLDEGLRLTVDYFSKQLTKSVPEKGK